MQNRGRPPEQDREHEADAILPAAAPPGAADPLPAQIAGRVPRPIPPETRDRRRVDGDVHRWSLAEAVFRHLTIDLAGAQGRLREMPVMNCVGKALRLEAEAGMREMLL